ncbi:Histone acetyltransferase MYST1 [Giardia muris]|uniref:histone acetyltransferase n=1 Tax=Giardia muris TaxID=5742 RepID=A0A4Z1SRI5_GIAMU|nr:Histone acetyltransferase MYST1 [Giardia muris]|eukprot:TNJ27585.1 Histone acetyltransferase MYST1 [Giardia muris]
MKFLAPRAILVPGALVAVCLDRGEATAEVEARIAQVRPLGSSSTMGQASGEFGIRVIGADNRGLIWVDYRDLRYLAGPPSTKGATLLSERRWIESVILGQYTLETWYSSPYPEPYTEVTRLLICPYCMRYMRTERAYQKHMEACSLRMHPPGLRIYADGYISVYEVDGRSSKLFCQCLCLLAKLFLDSKSLFYDTEIFLFYVMTVDRNVLEQDMRDAYGNCDDQNAGYRHNVRGTFASPTAYLERDEVFVGYFSKEKTEWNVLACLLVLPCYHRMGLGTQLIDFAYLIGGVENRQAGPEEPLSKLGEATFHIYWRRRVLEYILGDALGLDLEKLRGELPLISSSSKEVVDLGPSSGLTEDSGLSHTSRTSGIGHVKISIVDLCEATGLLKRHAFTALAALPHLRFRQTDAFEIPPATQDGLISFYRRQEGRRIGKLARHRLQAGALHWNTYTTLYRRKDRLV